MGRRSEPGNWVDLLRSREDPREREVETEALFVYWLCLYGTLSRYLKALLYHSSWAFSETHRCTPYCGQHSLHDTVLCLQH